MRNANQFSRNKRFIKSFEIGNGVKIRAAVVDGKEKIVTVTSPEDVLQGRVGEPARCVEACCLMRYSNENKLPHPAFAAWVYKRVAFLLATKRPGKNGLHTAVRYLHGGWNKIREFDRTDGMPPQERVRKLGKWTIVLSPPTKTNRVGAYVERTDAGKKSGSGVNVGASKKREPRGVKARLLTLNQWREAKEMAG